MELTGKQRAQLRAMANELEPIVHIGKDGIGENLVKQANDALEARELIKCRVLDNSMLTAREACDELSRLTRSERCRSSARNSCSIARRTPSPRKSASRS